MEETLEHLFLHCPFASQCWGILNLDIPGDANLPDIVSVFEDQLNSSFFMVAVILMSWTIWTARNKLVFEGMQMNIQDCNAFFNKEILMVTYRVKPSLSPQFHQWISSLN